MLLVWFFLVRSCISCGSGAVIWLMSGNIWNFKCFSISWLNWLKKRYTCKLKTLPVKISSQLSRLHMVQNMICFCTKLLMHLDTIQAVFYHPLTVWCKGALPKCLHFGFCALFLTGFLTGWNLTLRQGGMRYRHGELTVPTSGVYLIYSQLYYTTPSNKSVTYYVCVNNIEKVKGVNSGSGAFNTISLSFLSPLDADDIITLKLGDKSNRAFLVEEASFFGAFLVSRGWDMWCTQSLQIPWVDKTYLKNV